jgi:hypothetical protein
MKLWIGTAILLIAFSGCSEKSPSPDNESKGHHDRSSEVAAIEEAARAHGTITDDQIEILVGYLGGLNLEGLTELPVAQAEKLCRHQCGLGLDGLTKLTDPLAEALSGYQGMFLGIRNLSELTDNQARSLANYNGMINFGANGDYFLSKVLSYQGSAELKALHETVRKTGSLTDAETQTIVQLAPYSGLFLPGLVSLSDRQAEILGGYTGYKLYLDGLTELTDNQTKSLAQYQGSLLSLPGLTKLTDRQAENLAAFEHGLYIKNEKLDRKVQDLRLKQD